MILWLMKMEKWYFMLFPGHLACMMAQGKFMFKKELLLQKEVWLYLCRQLRQLEEPFRPLVQLVIRVRITKKKELALVISFNVIT